MSVARAIFVEESGARPSGRRSRRRVRATEDVRITTITHCPHADFRAAACLAKWGTVQANSGVTLPLFGGTMIGMR